MNCVKYNFSLHHLIIPPFDIFKKLCASFDKTDMFIVTFFRLLSVYLYFYLNNFNNSYITYFIYSLSIINISSMIILLLKKPKNSQYINNNILNSTNDLIYKVA